MEKKSILEKVYETAKRYELKSGGCAKCTIAAIFDVLGVEDEGVFKAATGMADGVGLTGDGRKDYSRRAGGKKKGSLISFPSCSAPHLNSFSP